MMERIEEDWRRYKVEGDMEARNRIIVSNLPLVKYVVSKIVKDLNVGGFEVGDLVGYGVLGLIDAVERFDPKRGIKFSTYAVLRIRGEIIDALRSFGWTPRKGSRDGRIDEEVEDRMEELRGVVFVSADEGRLADREIGSWKEDIDEELKGKLVEIINGFPEKERIALALYYYEGLTLKEIGAVLGISESRVSQIIASAISKMKAKLEEYLSLSII
jgi:RNA polymerase sigma factor for flagellar operon FliA